MSGWRKGVRLNRARWERVRRAVFKRDGRLCVECGRTGRLECDHIRPLHQYPDQDPYDMAGLATRCRECHRRKSDRELRKTPEVDGQAEWTALLAESVRDTHSE